MRKLLRLVCLLVVIAGAVAPLARADDDMVCVPGWLFRDPLTGEMVDCLESAGNDCLYCTLIIVVQG